MKKLVNALQEKVRLNFNLTFLGGNELKLAFPINSFSERQWLFVSLISPRSRGKRHKDTEGTQRSTKKLSEAHL